MKNYAVATGLIVFLLIIFIPLPSLNPESHYLAGIMGLVLIFWVTEAIPLPVTAIIGPLLCVSFGVADIKNAFAYFAHPIIFLFMGSFFIAEAMVTHNLHRRAAFKILSLGFVRKYPISEMIKMGILLDIVGIIIVFLWLWLAGGILY